MKKLYFTILFFLSTVFLFADFSQEQKAFVSSSIQDKVSILKKQIAILEKDLPLLDMALDFCLTNAAILSDSTHLHDLLFVSLYALPQDNLEPYDSALKKLFFLYNKEEIRVEILNLLTKIAISEAFFTENLYNFLFEEIEKDYSRRSNKSIFASLQYLSSIQDLAFFNKIYPLLSKNIDFELKKNIEEVLALSIENYKNDLLERISTTTAQEKKLILSILGRNPHLNLFFKAEVTENLLRATIISIGDNTGTERESLLKEFYEVQMESVRIIKEAKWTRAASLVAGYFPIAVEQYTAFLISKDELLEVMDSLTLLATSETGRALSDYLAVLNKKTEKTGLFDEEIMLHLISALAQLGEKTAFDNLLYVILHEGYPDSIISASKEALAKLNW
ncbi:MAG TPA: hypothetical protein PKW26_02485 [Treponemataceae bacterium]|nr:hypothetical protein [Treponemataceae bacterium]